MATPTTELRLRVAQLVGDLGHLVSHFDTIDEIDRNACNAGRDAEAILAELTDAHFVADVMVARTIELSKACEQLIVKGGA
jgi:hypothetical protein